MEVPEVEGPTGGDGRRFTKEIQVVPTECSNLRSIIKLAHFCDYTYWRCPQQDFGMEVPEVEGPTGGDGRRFTKEIQVVPTECSNLRSIIKLAHFCDYTYWRCPQQDFGMEVPEVEGPTGGDGRRFTKEIQVVPTECSNLRSIIKLAHFCDYTYWRCPQQPIYICCLDG